MTNFNAGDPSNNADSNSTPFATAGGSTENNAADDNTVVLELNGRKYTKADLAKKLTHADTHIEQLTRERAEARKLLEEIKGSLKTQVDVAEVLRSIKEGNVNNQQPPSDQPPPQQVDANTIASQVMSTIQAANKEAEKESNFKMVSTTLTAVYGDKVNQIVQSRAAELGMTVEEAAELARNRPKAFLQFFPEAKQAAMPPSIQNGTTVHSFNAPVKKPVHWAGLSTKDAVSTYQARLKELGL